MNRSGLLFLCCVLCLTFNKIKAESGYTHLKTSPVPSYSALGYTAFSKDLGYASSFYYNPAFLSLNIPYYSSIQPLITSGNIYFSYFKYYEKINNFFFSTVLDIKSIKRIGFGIHAVIINDIMRTTHENEIYNIHSRFNEISYTLFTGYGFPINDQLGLGFNIKIPVENLDGFQAIGLGCDIGLLYNLKNIGLTLIVKNIGQDIKTDGMKADLPLMLCLAGHYKIMNLKNKHKLTVLSEFTTDKNIERVTSLGLQYSLMNSFFIRNGYIYNSHFNSLELKVGCGIQYQNYNIDYAYINKNIDSFHKVGLGIKLNFWYNDIETYDIKKGTILKGKNTIKFDKYYTEINRETFKILDEMIEVFKQYPFRDIYICCYSMECDEELRNITLSSERAQKISAYFTNKDISKKRIKCKGLGSGSLLRKRKFEKGSNYTRITLFNLSSEEQERFDIHFIKGVEYFYQEEYALTIIEWEEALKINPKDNELNIWIKKIKEEYEY